MNLLSLISYGPNPRRTPLGRMRWIWNPPCRRRNRKSESRPSQTHLKKKKKKRFIIFNCINVELEAQFSCANLGVQRWYMIPNCQSRKVQDCGSHLPAPQRWPRTCQMVWDSPVQAGESLLDIVFGIQYQGQNRYYIFYSVGSTLYLSIKESWQIYQVNTCSERFGRLWWKGKERKKPFFFFSLFLLRRQQNLAQPWNLWNLPHT